MTFSVGTPIRRHANTIPLPRQHAPTPIRFPTRPYADTILLPPIRFSSRRYGSPPADTPERPYAPTPLLFNAHTPIRFSFRRYDSPSADTFRSSVGIVRVFYGTLPLHKGVIADYNL
jgi:hypothetical protein